ncbi:ATP-binding protein [Heliorestis convoluta]|uniref:ATP-binding protein n=1 Tax=Heliorestis convoluta TaxID=356322 RepID=A0A5Q2MVR7_9FIRM|nr:ATP-binding protein [Heliorestis convoluta]QGG46327.1 ATP-binding protein [Heliorestis convoluta]
MDSLLVKTTFEEDYLYRTYSKVTSSPDIAFTELIANSWDSGALTVKIIIPAEAGDLITIEDNGNGMTYQQFLNRWMKLAYNRLKHQGADVEFPIDVQATKRRAYGRNGIGRHGLLCFNNMYDIETWRDGSGNKFTVSTASNEQPIKIIKHEQFERKGHGTKLSVLASRNLPNSDEMLEILSARFLYDPQFVVYINEQKLDLSENKSATNEIIQINDEIELKVTIVDSSKSARNTMQHGVAFWAGGRLIGEPSWSYGKFVFADGRRKIAKRFTFIVESDELFDEILPDWTGFRNSYLMNEVYRKLNIYVSNIFQKAFSEDIEEVQMAALKENIEDLEAISNSPIAKYEVSKFINDVTNKKPDIPQDALNVAVAAMLNIEKSRSGVALLSKLSKMSTEEITALNSLLEEWTVSDVLSVISEIDARITTIEAITRLSGDKTVDELNTLHPIVLQSRWLFGPEYDSINFVSNVSLKKAIEQLFGQKVIKDEFVNERKRPDIIVLSNSTVLAVCIEDYDDGANLNFIDKILIIELKRGGFKLGRDEVTQAQYYVQDLLNCSFVAKNTIIRAYVVGETIEPKTERVLKIGENDRGRVDVCTFAQLIDTAQRRLFNLKKILSEHYEKIDNDNIVAKALKKPKQQTIL